MSIVLITEEAIPPVYRFSLTEKLALELANRGIEVYLVCRKGEGDFGHNGINYCPVDVKEWSLFKLKKRAEANIRLLLKVIKLLNWERIKLVYGWWPVLFFARLRGARVSADMPEFIDVMYRSFNKPLSPLVSPLLRIFQTNVARMCSLVITESDIARAVWASRGINYSKTSALPYGADVEFFEQSSRDSSFRERYLIGEDEPIVMFHGDIGIDDGVDILIEATRDLDAKVVIIGEGDQTYIKFLRDIAHSNVIFTGWIPYKQIPGVLKNADIYVAPFRSSLYTNSTCPLKIMEAMAAGRPLIVSKLHTLSLYLEDERNCLFFTPGDIGDLKRKLSVLLSSKDLRERLGVNGVRTAKRYFDFKIRVQKEADLLIELL